MVDQPQPEGVRPRLASHVEGPFALHQANQPRHHTCLLLPHHQRVSEGEKAEDSRAATTRLEGWACCCAGPGCSDCGAAVALRPLVRPALVRLGKHRPVNRYLPE